GDGVNPCLEVRHEFLASVVTAKRFGDALDVVPNVGDTVGRQGNDPRDMRIGQAAQGGLNIFFADGAYLALGLRQNHIGAKFFQLRFVNAIDRDVVLQRRFDALIDLAAGPMNVELWSGADRQRLDTRRKVAFMRSAHKLIAKAEGTGDFRGAGDQGDGT